MNNHTSTQNRRHDLQGIRGIAIISVLLFHFFPKLFPNGYVGVDQFFVLSGFLMTMIFGSKDISVQTTRTFYWRRIRRIVPLYLFVISLVLILLFPLFPNTFYSINVTGALYACLFYTNLAPKNNEHEYFKQLYEANDLFTHTWSLAVEMQFYLIVPFLFILLKSCKSVSSMTVFHLMVSGISLTFYLVADENTAFNNVLCRIWQFEVGIVAFFVSQKLTEKTSTGNEIEKEAMLKDETTIEDSEQGTFSRRVTSPSNFINAAILAVSLFSLIVCALFPYKLPNDCIRILSTLLTGVTIVFGTDVYRNPLENRFLVHIGDISYALYLVHWPIYVWIHFNFEDQIWVNLSGIFFAIAVAHLIYCTYEKWYLSLGKWTIIFLLIVLWTFIFLVILKADQIGRCAEGLQKIKEPTTYVGKYFSAEQARKINQNFDVVEDRTMYLFNCNPHKDKHGFCVFNETTYHGALDIAMVGNSYTPNQGDMVFKYFNKFAKNMTKFSKTTCEVFVYSKGCWNSYASFLKYAKDVNPDVLFIMSRHFKINSQIVSSNLTKDPLFMEAWNTLQQYENSVKRKVFILNSIPFTKAKYRAELNKMIANRKGNITDFIGVPINARIRLNELQKRCKKCEFFDYDGYLTDSKGNPQVFDPRTKITYLTTGSHLTAAGKEVVRPVYQKLAKSFEKEYKAWGFRL